MKKLLLLPIFVVVFSLLSVNVLADSPQPTILLVEDAHLLYSGGEDASNSGIDPFFVNALDANGLTFDKHIVSNGADNGPNLNTLSKYDIVIWFTGNDFGLIQGCDTCGTTLTFKDRNNLIDYLDDGGTLFLTGQDVGWDILTNENDDDFYNNYLHAKDDGNDWIDDADDCSTNTPPPSINLKGKSSEPIGNSLIFSINPTGAQGDGLKNQRFPSIIDGFDSNTSESVFYNVRKELKPSFCKITSNDEKFLGILSGDTGTHKVVYSSFGFESAGDDTLRQKLMSRIVNVLGTPKTKDLNVTPSLTNSKPDINSTCTRFITDTLDHPLLFPTITDSEYFVNDTGTPPKSQFGSGTALSASDGSFDSQTENVTGVMTSAIFDGLTDGSHTVHVHCKDSKGYWGKFDNFTFTKDTDLPTPPDLIIQNNDTYTNKVTPELRIHDISNGGNAPDFVEFSCDNAAFSSSVKWTDIPLAPDQSYIRLYSNFNINTGAGCTSGDENKIVYVRAKDNAGNIEPPSPDGRDNITLDTIAPIITSTTPANNSFLTSSQNINISFSDESSGIDSSIANNGTHNISFSNNTAFNPGWNSDGGKTLQVFVTDNAGNVNNSKFIYTVDDTLPSVTIDNPISNATLSGIVNLLTIISDSGSGIDKVLYHVINVTSGNGTILQSGELLSPDFDTTWNSTANISATAEVMFNVTVNDTVNNIRFNVSVTFNIDNTEPTATIIIPRAIFKNSNFNLDLRASSPVQNISNVTYFIFNSSNTVFSNQTLNIDKKDHNVTDLINNISDWSHGNYSINFTAVDTLGKNSTDISWVFIDKIPPDISNMQINGTLDPIFNDIRLYPNEAINFSLNATENLTQVSKVIATVSQPNSIDVNFSLSLLIIILLLIPGN